MRASGCILFISLLILSWFSFSLALSDAEASLIAHRQLLSLQEKDNLPNQYEFEVDVQVKFANPRLKHAYVGLQAWKKAMYSDPLNFTSNWEGHDVCSYKGVFCSPALDDPKLNVVSGVDLNHGDIAGYLPVELGLLTDAALFHINSNRFCGIIPKSFEKLKLIHEFDVSNNRFVGQFPNVVLSMPNLKYLDIRYNNFEGDLPPQLFDKALDALFLNDNRFASYIPDNLGKSPASVIVFANNNFKGCIPRSIGNMTNTLNEIVFLSNELSGCLPPEIGLLGNATVIDTQANLFAGILPTTLTGLEKVEHLDVAYNKFTGLVSDSICRLPSLVNFTFGQNYFTGEEKGCQPGSRKGVALDDTSNCLRGRPKQKSQKECVPVVSKPVDCSKDKCSRPSRESPNQLSTLHLQYLFFHHHHL
ncbi:hypothetical protein RJ639_006283 [Escallonia herrerae]|uniref:Cell wall hydroxyproline-rich glycoprotein n=1 Tax=Escallonia herrerae TaxID=1293975 RepID=A0AA89AUT8_9ASTE|nr:hypothetical protein RJ639_006283 [Escallonia herrerae]